MTTASYKILVSTLQKSILYRFNSNLLKSNILKEKSSFLERDDHLDGKEDTLVSSGFLADAEFSISKNIYDFILWKVAGHGEEDSDAMNTDVTLIKLPFSVENAVKITSIAAGKKSARYIYVACSTTSIVPKSVSFILIWDRKEEKYLTNIIPISGPAHQMVLTTDDQKLAACLSNSIAIHSVKHNTTSYLENPFEKQITCIDFYPFKKSVLVAGGKDGSIAVWDINTSPSPYVLKKKVHASAVTGVSFAPCNKHFYCSVGSDRMVHFHDINSPATSKGLLQSFQSEFPLLSLSINDDHTVAMGDSRGHVLIYDLRQKQLIHSIDTEFNEPILALSFQPPKWAMTAASKDQLVYDTSKRVIAPKPERLFDKYINLQVNEHKLEAQEKEEKKKESKVVPVPSTGNIDTAASSVMDIFSPVNKGRIIQPKTNGTGDLRRAATLGLFHEKLKNVKSSMSSEQLGTPTASISSAVPSSLRIAKSADYLGPVTSSSALTRENDLNETVMALKADLESKGGEIEDDRAGNEEQTPTQKQLQFLHHGSSKSLDRVRPVEEQSKPPQAPTPFNAKTPINGGSLATIQASGLHSVHSDMNHLNENPNANISDRKGKENRDKGMESINDAITTETCKRFGGMIGGPQLMTPSAFLKSAYSGNHVTDEGVERDSTLEQVTAFQYKMIRNIVEEVVQDYHEQIRRDVQNVHIEIIKQFSQQKPKSLKYRFELSLKDVQFVVESLLLNVKANLFQKLNVEELTNQLKQKQFQSLNKSNNESLLEENKKEKRELWASLKVKSFARTIVSVYLVNLVTIFCCVQLSLLGRFAYIDSVTALRKKQNHAAVYLNKLNDDENQNAGEKNDENDDNDEIEKCISENVERDYLTLSWYLVNVGWSDCVDRVQNAVANVVGKLPLAHSVTHETIDSIMTSVREAVEKDEDGDRFPFHKFLLPEEGQETTVLAEGGLSERTIEEPLKSLINETRDFLESADFLSVLENTLNESCTLLREQFKPVFFDQIVTRPQITGGISFAAGDDYDSPSAHDQASKSFPLAGILPLITKTSQSIMIGVPNLYMDMVLNNPKLLILSTTIYSSWD